MSVEGAWNLRDLGGLAGANGRRVRHGQLIRSGELAGLSESGAARLAELGLARIIDFRSEVERGQAPTTAKAIAHVSRWHNDAERSLGDPAPFVERCIISADQTRRMTEDMYRRMPFQQHGAFSALITQLLSGGPVLFHCAAGKDRTGVAAALVLSLLGVEREAIRQDYAATDAALEHIVALFVGRTGGDRVRAAPRAHWLPLLQADPIYLDVMFDAIKQSHGSVETYAHDCLRQPTDVAQRLQDLLLD